MEPLTMKIGGDLGPLPSVRGGGEGDLGPLAIPGKTPAKYNLNIPLGGGRPRTRVLLQRRGGGGWTPHQIMKLGFHGQGFPLQNPRAIGNVLIINEIP